MEGLALKYEKAENWKAFYAMLALLIHVIVLFPNIDNFVGHVVVEVFLSVMRKEVEPFVLYSAPSRLVHVTHAKGSYFCF